MTANYLNQEELSFTILGCGSSPGVPRVGNDWGACDPNNPKNRRTRCSLLVEKKNENGTTRVLIDTGPDFREQMLSANVDHLDAVLYTHAHADHVHGIDDLRGYWIRQRKLVEIYCDDTTFERLDDGFGYCFKTPEGSSYPPILNRNRIKPGVEVTIEGAGGAISTLPFKQQHGDGYSLGFHFGQLAYSSDVSGLDEIARSVLRDVPVWIVDALRYTPHPSHFSVEQALDASVEIMAGKVFLTHMHIDLDFEELKKRTPENAAPAHDGLNILL